MSGVLDAITGFIAANPHLAYAVILLLALSESIPVIGAVVPGSAVIIAASALVPGGALKLWPLLIAAVAGAILGDGFSYWLGRRYQRTLLSLWPLRSQPELVARTESFFTRHGDKSVFIARFTPGVRAFIPLFAGILGMRPLRFYIANILSALVWAPSHILPGMLAGASAGLFGEAAKPLAIIVLVLIALIWLGLNVGRAVILRLSPPLTRGLEAVRGWAAGQGGWRARLVLPLLDPQEPQARVLAMLALLLAAAAWGFFGILEDVVNGDPLVQADAAIYHALQSLRTPALDSVMITITELGDTAAVIPVTAAVFLWLVWARAWRMAGYLIAAVGGASALNTVIKLTLHRARPGDLLYTGSSEFSFPSGHSTTNLALYGFLAFLIARSLSAPARMLTGLAAVTFIVLIGLSRLYLGAHWFSDVAGGFAFGTAWLAILTFSFVRSRIAPVRPLGLASVVLLALLCAGGFNVYRHHATDIARYSIKPQPALVMSMEDWEKGGWQDLPARRTDLFGETEEPMTIQWAGQPAQLMQALRKDGWRQPRPWDSAGVFSWLSAAADPASLPAVTRLSSGLPQVFAAVKPSGADSRLVLRLWPAGLMVRMPSGDTVPVYVGSVVEEQFERPLHLFTAFFVGGGADAARDALIPSLPASVGVSRQGSSGDWNGGVTLASGG